MVSMHPVNLNGRIFVPRMNSESGEVSSQTRFFYHQENDVVWAEYSGGDIVKGFLVGKVLSDGTLAFHYQHINRDHAIRLGKCVSSVEALPDGRLKLHEKWQWLDGTQETGTSLLEEAIA